MWLNKIWHPTTYLFHKSDSKKIATHWMNGFKVTSIVKKWQFQLNLMAWNMPTGSNAPFWTWKKCKNSHFKKKAGLSFWVLSFSRMFDPLLLYLHFCFQMGVSSFYLIWQGFIKIFLPLAKSKRGFNVIGGIYEFVNNHASKDCQQLN